MNIKKRLVPALELCLFLTIAVIASSAQEKATIVSSPSVDKTVTGVRVYAPGKCFNGYTLFNKITVPEGISGMDLNPIHLVDMEGNLIHRWLVDTSVSFGRLMPDGGLVYITDVFPSPENPEPTNTGIRKLSSDSTVEWFYPAFTQHDFRMLDNGNILIERNEAVKPNGPDSPASFIQRIEILSPEKKVLWQWKAENHMHEIEQLAGIKLDPSKTGLFEIWSHTNTCDILGPNLSGSKDKRFKAGNILFSLPHVDIIGVISYPDKEVVWAWGPGELDAQHQPTMLKNGHILLFDNGKKRGWSRIIELDPLSEQIVWEYHGDPKESFFSPILSEVSPLPNGNMLICEGTSNRIFEITPSGEIVWDFISTLDRKNTIGIIRANRYSPAYIAPLLRAIEQDKEKYALN